MIFRRGKPINKINKNDIHQNLTNYYKKKEKDGLPTHPVYHSITLPDGFVLKGIMYDMSKYLSYYKIPEELKGKTVLDIGAANGFFSFEFDMRGAKEVIAMDFTDAFWNEDLNQLMGTKVKFKLYDITKLDESFGKFDVVFCSNVLQHSSDIFGNIQRIKSITKGMAILCTEISENDPSHPMAEFILHGAKYSKIGKGERVIGSFWKPNMICFKEMALAAGFSRVEKISVVKIQREDVKCHALCGIIHCYP